jgi:hypothetical protein
MQRWRSITGPGAFERWAEHAIWQYQDQLSGSVTGTAANRVNQ